ncbi:hypothetical protein F5Y16DRAFT_124143 [Xylariaceae sp. FL0255]|nr:hypothetical protein F5Y16DRAFT_124143 [Xylariaceae sp. FL0255]
MADSSTSRVDVAVIGAGWYGLVTARTYLRLQPSANLLIIDSDSTVGGTWSMDRLYPNLVAQVRLGLFNYSDTPMTPNGGHRQDERVTGQMIYDYMQKYAEDHDLIRRIRFNTFVEDAKKFEGGWRLLLRSTGEVVQTEKLIMATGVTSIPSWPDLDISTSSIPVTHSRHLGTHYEALRDESIRNVVVVGAAKSAYDAVYLLLIMGKKVTWVIRRGGGGPLSILPFRILNLIHSIAFGSTRLMSHLSPCILNTNGPLYRFFQKSIPGRWCVSRFWDFLEYVSSHEAGYSDGDHVAELKPDINHQSCFWANSGLGVVTMTDFWKVMHSPNLSVIRDEVKSVKGQTVKLSTREGLNADYMIMCTGWGDHFAMFDPEHKTMIGLPSYGKHELVEEDDSIDWDNYYKMADQTIDEKLPILMKAPEIKHPADLNANQQKRFNLYRRCIPVSLAKKGDRSLVILGQIHTIQTPLLAEVQSLYAILYMLGEVKVPDTDTMAQEVALWNTWTRKRYLKQGQKNAYSLFDFLPYIDSIFNDLKLKSRRKSNFISEILSPYQPSDFKGFVDEFLCLKKDSPASMKETV